MNHERLIWIDLLRSVAIIGVLVIHTLFSVFARTDFVGGSSWWMANLLVSFSRMSIPIFIMLSGYLVLSKNETFTKTLKRTWWRLGLPFLFWSLFYVWWDMFFFGLTPNWIEYGKQLFFGNMFILYFLVILVGLYLVSPFIRPFLIEKNRKSMLIATSVLLLFSAVTLLAQYLVLYDHSILNSFSLWIPYLGYFVIGYWIGHWKERSSKLALILGALLLIGYVSTFYFSYMNLIWLKSGISLLWQSSGGGVEYFGEYLSVNVIVMSIAFFALASMYRDQIARVPHVLQLCLRQFQLQRLECMYFTR